MSENMTKKIYKNKSEVETTVFRKILSIYTNKPDLQRMKEHFSKNKKCAKYTLKHTAKKL